MSTGGNTKVAQSGSCHRRGADRQTAPTKALPRVLAGLAGSAALLILHLKRFLSLMTKKTFRRFRGNEFKFGVNAPPAGCYQNDSLLSPEGVAGGGHLPHSQAAPNEIGCFEQNS